MLTAGIVQFIVAVVDVMEARISTCEEGTGITKLFEA